MKKLKLIINTIVKDANYRNAVIGAAFACASIFLISEGCEKWGRKIGAQKIMQAAEEMQPGFREALLAFVNENY